MSRYFPRYVASKPGKKHFFFYLSQDDNFKDGGDYQFGYSPNSASICKANHPNTDDVVVRIPDDFTMANQSTIDQQFERLSEALV